MSFLDDLRAGRPCIALTEEQVSRLPASIGTRIICNDSLRILAEQRAKGHPLDCEECKEMEIELTRIVAELDKLEGKGGDPMT